MLASYCAGLGADVLALQELDVRVPRSGLADQAAATARATGMAHAFGSARRVGGVGLYGNALLARDSVEDVDVVTLPSRRVREPRVALVATAVTGRHRLSAAATHLSTDGEEAREQLRAVLEALSARPPPRALLGDLNLAPADVQPAVEAAGMVLVDPGPPTYPAGSPRSRIDHIAVSGLAVTGVEVLPPAPVSDHRALRADVSAATAT